MPLFYVAHYEGFVGYNRRTRNVREARVFTSFEEADQFAKNIPLTIYAVLQTTDKVVSQADLLRAEYGHWGEHPIYLIDDWKYDTDSDFTRLGYWEWVVSCINEQDSDNYGR